MISILVRFFSCAALLAMPACGDDGGGGGSEGSSTGGSSTGGGGSTTSTEPGTTTSGGSGSSGGSSGPQEGSSSTAADGSGSESGTTGTPSDCTAQADVETCEAAMGCLWVGNPQAGSCLPDDPAVCPELAMMQCQQHPACEWSNQDAVCGPAGM